MSDILLETTIHDWRLADQCDEDLSSKQKAPWTVQVSRGGYGGLYIELCDVDGTKRLVSIEADLGNVTVAAYRDADGDQDAKLHITQSAVFAEASRSFPGQISLIAFNETETAISLGPVPPSLEATPE
jgi:hypothetical protein